jgi:cyclin-dependent kinase regulatory subunit CKS1
VANRCEYSDKYSDDQYEYRHVILPKEVAKTLPAHRLLSDAEWRNLGVQQSRGWVHYATHRPEPHILLFRRPLGTDPQTGEVRPELAQQAKDEFRRMYGLDAETAQ